MQLRINNPSTVRIAFTDGCPRYFCLYDSSKRTYYFRYLDGKTPCIKFNIPDEGVYSANHSFSIVKVSAIELPETYPALPPAQRDRWKDVSIQVNSNLKGTPARIFTDQGLIEISADFYSYPPPIRLFLLLHETGHMLYTDEEYCDLFALVNFLRMGYNRSTAYYTLDKILSRTKDNLDRLKYLLTQITVNGDQFKPY